MFINTERRVAEALCCIITSVLIGGIIGPIAFAQDTNQPTKMKPVVVTGSYLPTAETVGPAPIETVSAADIQKVGATDVLDLLKRLSPSFSGNANTGQTGNNGSFGEAYISIRNLPTLVMLNGHRLGNSALSVNAGQNSTGAQYVDVNTLPLAMIDRIEVLKDGASALYGSQAIGGVVNIILKKDFNGSEIGGRYGFATGKGDFVEYRAHGVTGFSTEKGSFTAGVEYYNADPLLSKNREVASLGNAERGAINLGPASYISPSYTGKVQSGPGNNAVYLLANSPFLTGKPGYNANLLGGPADASGNFHTAGSPPVYAGQIFSGASAVDDYNAYAIAHGYMDPTGNGFGPYVNTRDPKVGLGSATLLNTTLFGTHSIQSQDRKQAFANGEHDLLGKELQIFGQFLYSNNESVGALAPSPVLSLYDPTANISVPSNNAYNPFGVNLGPPGGAAAPRIRSRFIQSGNRIFDTQTDFAHFVGGLKGDFENDWHYETAYTYNLYDQNAFTKQAVNGSSLDAALRPNPDPALAAQGLSGLKDSSGNYVPMYNIFFSPTEPFPTTMGPNDPSTINAIRTTLFEHGRSEEWDYDGVIRGSPVQLPAGKLAFAAGGGFRSESLNIDYDGLTRAGKAPGLNPADPTSGRRDSYALFAEVRIPVTSPDMDIPVLHSMEITAAGRYESFDPGGDSAVPKVTLRWQPLDEQFTLRGSYSQSFVAPATYQLFGGRTVNNPFIALTGDSSFTQESTVNRSNPTLQAVDAENYSAGIVISPKAVPGLTLSVDYYHVKTKNDIFRFSEQSMANDLEQHGSASPFASLFRFNDGSQLTTTDPKQITSANWGTLQVPLANGSSTETDGLDLTAAYRLSQWQDTAGIFTIYASANVLFNFKYGDPLIGGPYQYKGFYTDRLNGIGGGQGLLPEWQITTGLSWEFRNFTYSINARYVPEVSDPGTLFASNLNFEKQFDDQLNDFTGDGTKWKIGSYFTIDMQLAYEIGKNKPEKAWYDGTRIAIGCNNITDELPPLIASSFEDNTDKSTYSILGRFVYFELSKKF
jgi:iron complex outermembrane receptor protein